jgi:integral membrane protein
MSRLTQRGLRGTLFRYQVMANIVGTLIIPLYVFTLFKLIDGQCKLEVEIFGATHGYLYIVYLLTVGALSFRTRLNPIWILIVCAAGLIPGMTFYMEWFIVTRKVHPLIAAEEAAAAIDPAPVQAPPG